MTAGGNPQSLILCVLDVSVVGDRSPYGLYAICNVSFYCPLDVPDKALRILFLMDTLSATWLLCLLNDGEVSRSTPKIFGHWDHW